MRRIVQALQATTIGQALHEETVERLAQHVEPVIYRAGATIYSRGDEADFAYFLVRGKVQISVSEGRSTRVLRLLEPGEHFGDVALFQQRIYPVTATAIEESETLRIERDVFMKLSTELPNLAHGVIRSLGLRLMDSTNRETPRPRNRLVAMVYDNPDAERLMSRTATILCDQGERIFVISDQMTNRNVSWGNESLNADQRSMPQLNGRIAELLNAYSRVIIGVRGDSFGENAVELLESCHQIFWCVDAKDEPQRRRFEKLVRRCPTAASHSQAVYLIEADDRVVPEWHPQWEQAAGRIAVPMNHNAVGAARRSEQGVRRIVRSIQGIRLGLALGGGAARGLAHLGVLRSLDRADLDFDLFVGTSCGAMVAILYAAGYSPDELTEYFVRDLTPPWPLSKFTNGRRWYMLAKFRTGGWEPMLRAYLHQWKLEQLQIPVSTVAVDLVTADEITRSRGDAVDALLESINLPIFAPPICRDGMALVDGGMLNTMPTSVLASRDVDLVVGVNVTGTLENEFVGNRPDTPTKRMRSAGFLQTYLRVMAAQSRARKGIEDRAADVLIEPDATSFDLADFLRAPELAETGEAAAESLIPEIKRQISDLTAKATIRPNEYDQPNTAIR